MTTQQAAQKLGISEQAVRALCERGGLTAEKFGRQWMIREDVIANFQRPKRGRPNSKK